MIEKLKDLFHGQLISCKIEDREIPEARISIHTGYIYICHNDPDYNGSRPPNNFMFNFKMGWTIGRASYTSDFRYILEEYRVSDLKELPNCKTILCQEEERKEKFPTLESLRMQ